MNTLLPALIVGGGAIVIVPMWWRRTSTAGLGTLLAIGLVLPHGVVAIVCTLPWLGLVVTTARRVVIETGIPANTERLAHVAAHLFLIVGAASATIAAAGWRPLGFAPVIIVLTAAHFHYAGFAFGMIASGTQRDHPSAVTACAIAAWAVGVPLVAIGIAADARVEPYGAVVVSVAGAALGFQLLRAARYHHSALLGVAGLSVIAAMVLAAGYGLAPALGFRWLDIAPMERVHGMVNAIGFALCATVGWRRLSRGRSVEVEDLCMRV